MAREVNFEEMDSRDWPADLRALRQATESAYDATLFIDVALTGKTKLDERSDLLNLWQRAYHLYKQLQSAGLNRLAEEELKGHV